MTAIDALSVKDDAAPMVRDRAYQLGRTEGRIEALREAKARPTPSNPARSASPASFTAAARKIEMANPAEQQRIRQSRGRNAWQEEAWGYFDALAEVKNGARFKGRSLSKLRLYIGVIPEPGAEPIPLEDAPEYPDLTPIPPEVQTAARDILDRLAASRGYETLLDRWGRNSFVVGESYLVGYPDLTSPSGESFYMASPDELRVTDKGEWALVLDPADKASDWEILPAAESIMVRIWNQHARYGNLPDSSIRGVLDICEILLAERNSELGDAFSRANNGILMLPHGMVGYAPPNDDDVPEAGSEALRNPTVRDIYDHILTPIGNPRSPSVAAPFIMTADPDDIDKVKFLTFTTDRGAPEKIAQLRQELAQGVDLPEEVLLGFGNATYSNSWIINDQTWTFYLQPDANQLMAAITTGLFRPLLLAGNVPTQWATRLCIWYDKSQLVGDPDETTTALESVRLGLLGNSPARRRLGYSEEEAPTQEDLDLRLALTRGREVVGPGGEPVPAAPTDTPAQPPTDAETPPAAEAPPAATAAAVTAAAGRPSRARLDAMSRRWAKRDRALMDRLLAQADTAMMRALDRAGAKLRTKAVRASAAHDEAIRHVPNAEVALFLGPGVVTASLGFSTEDLLSGSFDELAARYDSQVGRAQAATRQDLIDLGLDEDQAEEMAAAQEEDRQRGRAFLLTSVTALAAERLFSPKPNAPAAGEYDGSMSVPVNFVRQALTTAGGSESGFTPGGTARHPVHEDVAVGVTDGTTVGRYLSELGLSVAQWRWVYGDSERNFEPHLALDGEEFTSWSDDALANPESWPPDPFYFPGDHLGCQCGVEQVITLDEASSELTGLSDGEAA